MTEWNDVKEKLEKAQKVLVGIGAEWKLLDSQKEEREKSIDDPEQSQVKAAYDSLYKLIKDKDYYVVTTLTDGVLMALPFNQNRVCAPCGNIHWRQCSKACSKDIWEEGEIPDDICPHCGAPLTGNTIKAETYIEEGYLPRWKDYMNWQTGTFRRDLVILELGEGFLTPTVMRWPFEKITLYNKQAHLYRVHETLYQVPKEIEERSTPVCADSMQWICDLAQYVCEK